MWFVTWTLVSLPGIQVLVTSTITAQEPRSFWRSTQQHTTGPAYVSRTCHWLLARLPHWAYFVPVEHYFTRRFHCCPLISKRETEGTSGDMAYPRTPRRFRLGQSLFHHHVSPPESVWSLSGVPWFHLLCFKQQRKEACSSWRLYSSSTELFTGAFLHPGSVRIWRYVHSLQQLKLIHNSHGQVTSTSNYATAVFPIEQTLLSVKNKQTILI